VSTTDGPGPEDPATASLQAAARQLIGAARGLLDAAEAAVDDPQVVRDAVATLGALAQEAARMAADAGHRATGDRDASPSDEDDPDPPGEVQHIPVD
jgi:hypothetical protein